MTAFLSLVAAALIASAGTTSDPEPSPTPPSRTADVSENHAGSAEPWAGLDLELVRLPGAADPVDPSAGSA